MLTKMVIMRISDKNFLFFLSFFFFINKMLFKNQRCIIILIYSGKRERVVSSRANKTVEISNNAFIYTCSTFISICIIIYKGVW